MNTQLTVQEIFKKVASEIQKHPERMKKVNGVYLFKINGDNAGVFHVDLKENPGVSFVEKKADCILEIRDRDFIKLYKGELSGFKAILNGTLKVKGSLFLANRLNDLFNAIRDENSGKSL